jgi:tRNA (guanine-N7-)-methyltransferase
VAKSPSPAEFGFVFSSSRGRADQNPYVEKIREYHPWALPTDEAEQQRGRWREALGLPPTAPLLLEIGPGNGFFFREVKQRFPDAGLIGLEIRFKRVWLTARKALKQGLDSFVVVHHHAAHLPRLFAPGELDAVFANHPDPWPKDRHHKHRLLSEAFRTNLESCLDEGGEFWLKSDFADYGPLALDLFEAQGWKAMAFTDDLHRGGVALASRAPEGSRFWAADLITNYEQKHITMGSKILVGGWRRLS